MIDEKKIIEAVNAYIGYPHEVDEGTSVSLQRKAFRAGAEWFKQSLWHEPDEEPQKGEQCLVDTEFLYEDAPEDNYHTFITSTYGKWGWTEESMPHEATHFKLHRWCYIKDLLKGGEI